MVRPAPPFASIKEDGSGLPGLLDRIQNLEPAVFEELQARVREFFPRLQYIRTPPARMGWSGPVEKNVPQEDSSMRELAILETGSSKLVYGHQLADGLILLIGYLAISLSHETTPSLLLLDEPEFGLHMDRSDFLVSFFRSLSNGELGTPVQVIITTHSPDIVDFLEPEELVVFRRDQDGNVVPRRASDSPNLYHRLKGYNLGEYWALFGDAGLLGE